MTKIRIDGTDYELPPELEGSNLLQVALSLGLDLPYFCWHPALDSVGACRQCAVKQISDDEEKPDRIVMACMTAADDGTAIAIEDEEAKDFRARVIEWLMVNHPHDCPVCDEGGECHLQDMTVMTGHNYRRFRFEKRTHENQYLGPFVNHEMNRCIACYRCVRFYRDYAGGRDLHALGAHHNVYFGRHADGVLESEFAGNLVEVCPTGVFTDKTLKQHYTRKWDLQSAPSVCVHCGVGCNTLAGERYGGVRRILNRYHHEVNGYFLCDRGRFGYEFANREDRVRGPLIRSRTGGGARLSPVAAVELDDLLSEAVGDGATLWGIGSPRASLEANFALERLVGEGRFSTGMAAAEQALAERAVELIAEIGTPSLRQVRRSDAVLVLGEDPSDTAPVLALALRRAAREGAKHLLEGKQVREWDDGAVRVALQGRTGPFYLATPTATRLDDVATESVRLGPRETAELGRAVAAALEDGRQSRDEGERPERGAAQGRLDRLAAEIAGALAAASRPVVVTGIACGSRAVLEAAAAVARALRGLAERGGFGDDDEPERDPSGLVVSFPECDSVGVTLLGGRPVDDVLEHFLEGGGDGGGTLLVLENDLFRRAPGDRVEALFDAVRGSGGRVVVLDHLLHGTARAADLVLPAAAFAEGDGTYVSSEGRAQRAFQVYVPEGELPADAPIEESWRWLTRLAAAGPERTAAALPWRRLDEVAAAVAARDPVFAPLTEVAPDAGFRVTGQKVPREPARSSGRTAKDADRSVDEPKPPRDPDAALAFSMEGTRRQPPPALIPYYWAPGWNSVQSLNRFQQEVGGPLRGGDPGRRLLEPGGPKPAIRAPRGRGPASRTAGAGELTVIPLHHVFGTDELSARAPAVAELTPDGYLALHPQDAASAGLEEGVQATLELPDGAVTLPLLLRDDLPRGVAGLPVGLPGVPYRRLPAKGGASAAAAEDGGSEEVP